MTERQIVPSYNVKIVEGGMNSKVWYRALSKMAMRLTELDPSMWPEYADDAAAAAGGVQVGGFYRTGSAIKVRVS